MTVEVIITVEVPDGIGTNEQLEEWLKYGLNYCGYCQKDNPFLQEIGDVDAQSIVITPW